MKFAKIVTTVPLSHADAVRKAVGDAIGIDKNYSHATFSVRGVGRFIPHDGANPAIGTVGKQEEVEEERIEWNCPSEKVEAAVTALRETHPYEVPMIDVYPLETL